MTAPMTQCQVAARREGARVVLGIFAILGVLGDLFSAAASIGTAALLQQLRVEVGVLSRNDLAAVVFGAVLAVAGAAVLVALAVSAFQRDTVAWCRPTPGTGGSQPTR
jgi:hypothetical protein